MCSLRELRSENRRAKGGGDIAWFSWPQKLINVQENCGICRNDKALRLRGAAPFEKVIFFSGLIKAAGNTAASKNQELTKARKNEGIEGRNTNETRIDIRVNEFVFFLFLPVVGILPIHIFRLNLL